MDRIAFFVISVLFFISAGMFLLAPYIYGSAIKGEISIWFYPAFFFAGLFVVFIIKYLYRKYRKEYDMAYAMSYTPKGKYGWYALSFFIIVVIVFYVYVILTKR